MGNIDQEPSSEIGYWKQRAKASEAREAKLRAVVEAVKASCEASVPLDAMTTGKVTGYRLAAEDWYAILRTLDALEGGE